MIRVTSCIVVVLSFCFWQPNTYVCRKLSRANTFASWLAQKMFRHSPSMAGLLQRRGCRRPQRFIDDKFIILFDRLDFPHDGHRDGRTHCVVAAEEAGDAHVDCCALDIRFCRVVDRANKKVRGGRTGRTVCAARQRRSCSRCPREPWSLSRCRWKRFCHHARNHART